MSGKLQSFYAILYLYHKIKKLHPKKIVKWLIIFIFLDVFEHLQIKSFYKSPLNLSHLYSAFMARPIISFRICNTKLWLITKEKDMCLTRSISSWLTIERDTTGKFGQKSVQKRGHLFHSEWNQHPDHWSFTTF